MKFAVCVLSLGYTRLAGITLYDSNTREFIETTPRVAKELISKGMVKGVKWKDDGFVPDPDFNMQDILVKTAVGKYRHLLHEVPGEFVNSTYMVVRVLETNIGKLYEVISNKCQRVKLTEDQLRGLNTIGTVGGVFISDDEIKICDGVIIENRVYPDEVKINNDTFENVLSGGEKTDTEVTENTEDEEFVFSPVGRPKSDGIKSLEESIIIIDETETEEVEESLESLFDSIEINTPVEKKASKAKSATRKKK